jgi:hypothetical protein
MCSLQRRRIKGGDMLLTIEELKELAGCKNKSKIKEWLRSKGVNFLEGADGYPKVSKQYIEDMLKGNIEIKTYPRKRGNVNALRELMSAE